MLQRVCCLVLGLTVSGLWGGPCSSAARGQAAADQDAPAAVIPQEELAAEVPALADLHEVVFELWHDAYPQKDHGLIRELLPRADQLTAQLDAATLPGILRDKQAAWDEGKGKLKAALGELQAASAAGDEQGMLEQTEAFHAAYEQLVRTVRPLVPELDAFHQELYKLYHYHAPQYDLQQIRAAAAAMQERGAPLRAAKLPKRLADRQEDFDAAVAALASLVDELVLTAQADDKDAVLAAIERVHTAYMNTEQIFD